MGPERPFTRPEDLGEVTVVGCERTTEDVLQFVHEKAQVAFDLTAVAGSVAPEQCKEFVHGSGAFLAVVTQHFGGADLAFLAGGMESLSEDDRHWVHLVVQAVMGSRGRDGLQTSRRAHALVPKQGDVCG
ncbi:hypothetical protein MYXA107069_36640 [Myxococcus xanthus]|nr:hypothetical protein [Myxococcus xanthus]QZZ53911.1 hypothetical protein MyxoNM_32280 [Myxococcus xanthus]SDY29097.1 hypothetical protein SAMN05444383_13212 [Myxococcus xanthus]